MRYKIVTELDRLQPLQRILGFILPIIHRGSIFFLQKKTFSVTKDFSISKKAEMVFQTG